MYDTLFFRNLRLSCRLGAYPNERTHPRPVGIDLDLLADLRPGTTSDRLEDTLNYDALLDAVTRLVEESHYRLIEALAEAIAQCCLDFERVKQVRVRIDKVGIYPHADSTGVEITRPASP